MKRKRNYAVILDKNGETMSYFKINPSYKEIRQNYEGRNYSYLLSENTPFVKIKNMKLYFWEFQKPEPLGLVNDNHPTMFSDVFDELLLMKKIKAINEVSGDWFSKINKKVIIGVVVVVIAIIVISQGGFF
jgi:hypothetical protein